MPIINWKVSHRFTLLSFNLLILLPFFSRNISTVRFKDESESGDEPKGEIEKISYYQVCKRILKVSRPEWFSIFLATVSAVFVGASFPIFAILFAEFYGVSKVYCINRNYTFLIISQ